MSRRVWQCSLCGEVFTSALDHKVHASTHIGQRSGRKRKVSCWGCATLIDPNETLTCGACGLTLPDLDEVYAR